MTFGEKIILSTTAVFLWGMCNFHQNRPLPPPAPQVEVEVAQEEVIPNTAPVNVNTADAAGLDTLPGVGEVLARNIVTYRRAHGRFFAPEDLLEVPGIGEKTLAEFAPYILFF